MHIVINQRTWCLCSDWPGRLCHSGCQTLSYPVWRYTFSVRRKVSQTLSPHVGSQDAMSPHQSSSSSPYAASLLTIRGPTFVVFLSFQPCVILRMGDPLQSIMGTCHRTLKYHKIHWTLEHLYSAILKEKKNESERDLSPSLSVGNSYFLSHILLGRKSITFGLRVIMGLKSCPVMQI